MSIDNRYVVSANLQDYLVDKDTGLPLSNGLIYCWKDVNRTQPKFAFKLSGSPPDYGFTELPNPIPLSGVGTTTDDSGNDIVPYWFPYDADGNPESYFLQIYSEGGIPSGVHQFDRQAWPPNAEDIAPVTDATDDANLIINGTYLFNTGNSADPIGVTDLVLAPGSSTGLIVADIRFEKNNTDSDDTITFTEFLPDEGFGTGTYLTYNCVNVAGTETFKWVRFPIAPNVYNLSDTEVTISFLGKSSTLSTLTVFIIQDYGTGGTPSSQDITLGEIFNLTDSFENFSVVVTIPDVSAKTLGTNGDSSLSIAFGLQLNSANETSICFHQMVRGNQPTLPYVYQIPQMVSGQVFTPRTGDVKASIRPLDPGWLLMDDGTIGNPESKATSRAATDVYPLYDLIWNQVPNSLAPIFTSAGESSTRGASSAADFEAKKALSLTHQLGRAMAGANPNGDVIINTPFTIQGSGGGNSRLRVGTNQSFFTGARVRVTTTGVLPSPLVAATTYFVIPFANDTDFQLAATLADALSDTPITITDDGSGTDFVQLLFATPAESDTPVGFYQGEFFHQPIETEMARHSHAYDKPAYANNQTTGADTGTITTASDDTGLTGNNIQFNVTSPVAYYNIYIKL